MAEPSQDFSDAGAPATGKALRDVFSANEIFQRITAAAAEEIGRPARLLLVSGISAGLAIGLTFLARASLTGIVGGTFTGSLLYPIGFILIVIGRYQLFTENTLTPVTLVLTRLTSLPNLFRIWGMALLGNLIGVAVVAYLTGVPAVLTPGAAEAAVQFAEHALSIPTLALYLKAQAAGFIVASMV